MIYRILDLFFVFFHSALTLFNVTGWIWRKTRLANLITLLLTGFSWLFLGMIVGSPGYCPLTDWHFRILEKMGKANLPQSYIKYLADRLTGLDFDPVLVDKVTLIVYLAALILSASLTVNRFLRKSR